MISPIDDATEQVPQCLAFTDGQVQITYAELSEKIDDFSRNHLASLRPGEHVAWCPGNDLEDLVTFWALQRCGLVACPVSYRIPSERRTELLRMLDATWLPTLERYASGKLAQPIPTPVDKISASPATIILSSGSTGDPKAVVHSMAAHIASAEGAASNMPLTHTDRWLWSLPMFHVSGLSVVVRCAVAGAAIVAMKSGRKLSTKTLEEANVSHLSVVSTQLRRLLEEPEFPPSDLKWVLLGGSAIDAKIVRSARKRNARVLTTYGLTEMASQVSTSTIDGNPYCSGKVLPNCELRIDETGEILVRGKTLCLGYYFDGQVHSILNAQDWFPTRDLGEVDGSGQLSVHGRIDNMFISGGVNIYPETIERIIKETFDVEQAVVVSKPDPVYEARPVVFVSGELPPDWQETLRSKLQGFEIPLSAFELPLELEESIKVSRSHLQKLVQDG